MFSTIFDKKYRTSGKLIRLILHLSFLFLHILRILKEDCHGKLLGFFSKIILFPAPIKKIPHTDYISSFKHAIYSVLIAVCR